MLALRCDAERANARNVTLIPKQMQVHWPLVVAGEISQQLIALYYSAGSAQCYYSKIKIICVCIDSELLLLFFFIRIIFFIYLLFFPFDPHFFKQFCSFFDSLQIQSHASFVLSKFLYNVIFFLSPFSNLILFIFNIR